METKVKRIQYWRMRDIQSLLIAIREIHSPKFDDMFADEIINRLRDESLIDLYNYCIVQKRELPGFQTSLIKKRRC